MKQAAVGVISTLLLIGGLVYVRREYGWVFATSRSQDGVVVPSSVDTGNFNGVYELDESSALADIFTEIENTEDENEESNLRAILDFETMYFKKLHIHDGVLTFGEMPLQEFSMLNGQIDDSLLTGKAVWHEDIYDPGDCSQVYVRLERRPDGAISFSFDDSPNVEAVGFEYRPAPNKPVDD